MLWLATARALVCFSAEVLNEHQYHSDVGKYKAPADTAD